MCPEKFWVGTTCHVPHRRTFKRHNQRAADQAIVVRTQMQDLTHAKVRVDVTARSARVLHGNAIELVLQARVPDDDHVLGQQLFSNIYSTSLPPQIYEQPNESL